MRSRRSSDLAQARYRHMFPTGSSSACSAIAECYPRCGGTLKTDTNSVGARANRGTGSSLRRFLVRAEAPLPRSRAMTPEQPEEAVAASGDNDGQQRLNTGLKLVVF